MEWVVEIYRLWFLGIRVCGKKPESARMSVIEDV